MKRNCKPKNIYSLSKNNEEVAQIYSDYYNINFVGLRLFTIYGEWGSRHVNYQIHNCSD